MSSNSDRRPLACLLQARSAGVGVARHPSNKALTMSMARLAASAL
jgi:hypothetical protein